MNLRKIEDAQRGPAGANHRNRRSGIERWRQLVQQFGASSHLFRITTAARGPEVHNGTLAQPRRIDAGTQRFDDTGELSARRHRQTGTRYRPCVLAFPNRGVDEVNARRLDTDDDLALARNRSVDLLPD